MDFDREKEVREEAKTKYYKEMGGKYEGKKLFEVDTHGEKGRHPHLDTPKVKKKLGKLTPGVSTFSHFYLVKSPPGGRAGRQIF